MISRDAYSFVYNNKAQKLAVRLLMKPNIVEFLNVKLFNFLLGVTYFCDFFVQFFKQNYQKINYEVIKILEHFAKLLQLKLPNI